MMSDKTRVVEELTKENLYQKVMFRIQTLGAGRRMEVERVLEECGIDKITSQTQEYKLLAFLEKVKGWK